MYVSDMNIDYIMWFVVTSVVYFDKAYNSALG